jgi:hypothetical protein
MSENQEKHIGDVNTKFSAKQDLQKWLKDAENQDLCIKFGEYLEDGTFEDWGTFWDIDYVHPEETVQVTDKEYRYRDRNTEYRLYLDSYSTDIFGQRVIFGNPPACYWLYIDKNSSDSPEFLYELDSEWLNELIEDPDAFTDWANKKYPGAFSCVEEYLDCNAYWICYTYNPQLSEQKVLAIMREDSVASE